MKVVSSKLARKAVVKKRTTLKPTWALPLRKRTSRITKKVRPNQARRDVRLNLANSTSNTSLRGGFQSWQWNISLEEDEILRVFIDTSNRSVINVGYAPQTFDTGFHAIETFPTSRTSWVASFFNEGGQQALRIFAITKR
jgi:hypothetical protein